MHGQFHLLYLRCIWKITTKYVMESDLQSMDQVIQKDVIQSMCSASSEDMWDF